MQHDTDEPINPHLPMMSFTIIRSNAPGRQIAAVKNGMRGYYPTTYDEPDLTKATELVKHLNERLGVNEVQAECMSFGSMFGWDKPGADYRGRLLEAKTFWTLRKALEQCRAALPDPSYAKDYNIDPELFRSIDRVLERGTDIEICEVLKLAKSALPLAWNKHGDVATDLILKVDEAIACTATTMDEGKQLIGIIARKLSFEIAGWQHTTDGWQRTVMDANGIEIPLAVSASGVVQVNRYPHTPDPEKELNVSLPAIEKSLLSFLLRAIKNLPTHDEAYAASIWMNEYALKEFGRPFTELGEVDQDFIRGKAEDNNIQHEVKPGGQPATAAPRPKMK